MLKRWKNICAAQTDLVQNDFVAECRWPITFYENNIAGGDFKLFAAQMHNGK